MFTIDNPFKEYALIAARSADQKQAENILLLDLRKSSYGLSDYLVLLTANSSVHLSALRDAIKDALEASGLYVLHQDGGRSSHWMVLDYGGLMVHLFAPEQRENFTLERLWEDAKKIRWEAKPVKPSKPAKSVKKTK